MLIEDNCPECSQAFAIAPDMLKLGCSACGESLTVDCRDCGNPFVTADLTDGRCEQCCESNARAAKRQRRIDAYEDREYERPEPYMSRRDADYYASGENWRNL